MEGSGDEKHSHLSYTKTNLDPLCQLRNGYNKIGIFEENKLLIATYINLLVKLTNFKIRWNSLSDIFLRCNTWTPKTLLLKLILVFWSDFYLSSKKKLRVIWLLVKEELYSRTYRKTVGRQGSDNSSIFLK